MCVCAPFCLNLYGTRSVSLLGYVFLPKRDSIPRPLDLTIGECFSLTEVQTNHQPERSYSPHFSPHFSNNQRSLLMNLSNKIYPLVNIQKTMENHNF